MGREDRIAPLCVEQQLGLENIRRLLKNVKKKGVNNFTTSYLQERLDLLNNFLSVAQGRHAEIASSPDNATLEYTTLGVYNSIIEAHEEAETYLVEHLANKREETFAAQATSSPLERTFAGQLNTSALKLPKFELPKFSGDYSEWANFQDLFQTAIHDRADLSPAQKLSYLKSCLKGEAGEAVKAFAITDANYQSAWAIISNRYENRRLIKTSVMNKLFAIPLVSANNATSMKFMRDTYTQVLMTLQNMGCPTDKWDMPIIHLLLQRFDTALKRDWEEHLEGEADYPQLCTFENFMTMKIQILEAITLSKQAANTSASSNTQQSTNKPKGKVHSFVATNASACPYCKSQHALYKCDGFRKISVDERSKFRTKANLCANCLRADHKARDCRSDRTCQKCGKRHHTLLHFESKIHPQASTSNTNCIQQELTSCNPNVNTHFNASRANEVLLATALVRVYAPNGQSTTVRALLDNGSESSFVSESLAQALRLRRRQTRVNVTGVGGSSATPIKHSVSISITPTITKSNKIHVNAFVLQNITSYTPQSCDLGFVHEFKDIVLADPQPYNLDRIEMLIGADLYGSILLPGLKRPNNSKLVAQNTLFGWVLFGPTPRSRNSHSIRVQHTTLDVSNQLQSFWQLEEVPQCHSYQDDNQRCEEHFLQTHSKDHTGRYIVRLPFKSNHDASMLGDSLPMARASLKRLRERLSRNPSLYEDYKSFLDEYSALGHMSAVAKGEETQPFRVFLPHHGVVRQDSSTTKLRVVFNASANTTSGLSLNDTLCPGPKLQNDITSVITNWRLHPFVYKADIEKMFRQVLLHPAERPLQCILWQDLSQLTPTIYELNTVSFGTVPAPFLAMRVIQQIVRDYGDDYPLAIEPLLKLIYVDDVLFGADTLPRLAEQREQISAILKRGGFNLRKWDSNVLELSEVRTSDIQPLLSDPDVNPESKVLGISWNSTLDHFRITYSAVPCRQITKRTILSGIARLYDPLGWLSPVLLKAKIILQDLWIAKLEWDDQAPQSTQEDWNTFSSSLECLTEVHIPRWINYTSESVRFELVGFCDASAKAYSATVYSRILDARGNIHAHLLMAKSKLAPLKTLTIPRLELCGAVLLTKLINFVRNSLVVEVQQTHCYCDSKIVLAWLAKSPSNWEVFVANRVSYIQTELKEVKWAHVGTKFNPADLNSRGIAAASLPASELWWKGPSWLTLDPLPTDNEFPETQLGTRKTRVSTHFVQVDKLDFVQKISTWPRLLRVTAFLFKFMFNLKARIGNQTTGASDSAHCLSTELLEKSRKFLISHTQRLEFAHEISCLQQGISLPRKSKLIDLNPFLDGDQLLRVGGRLENSLLSFGEKHPLILDKGHIATLLIRHTHLSSLHSGLQLTLQILRSQYWILNARNQTKTVIHNCVPCTRQKATLANQLMGNLPPERCSPGRAFEHVGVDYAGPFLVRASSGRGQKTTKCYLALFVCLTTRAIHLELVMSYNTPSFVAAFHRLVSRRGFPNTVYSDNATNFKGADAELQRAFKGALRDYSLQKELSTRSIQWKFIPPAAPHFGGIWEAGVKAVKHHLRRIMGNFAPTYEEFVTILTRIEACLNSRPIAKLRDTPDDLQALTPAHFLTGTSLMATPEPSTLDLNENRLTRWQTVSRVVQTFWTRWSGEYLQSLQARTKWKLNQPPLQIGEVVLVRDPNTPPTKWALGIITQLHTGKDNLTRVVTVKTSTTELQRPITQLCRLPVQSSEQAANIQPING